jgi:hypothetical protein
MACVSSPEPDDQALLAYIDGEAEPEVQSHVEQCPRCRQRAQQLAAVQHQLTARLYRALCPAPQELGEYHLDLLPPEQAEAVTRHLTECPHCTREIEQLAGYTEKLALSVESSLLERVREGVRVLVAKLVDGPGIGAMGRPALAAAYAGTRGEEREPCLYEVDGIQIVIGVQPDDERADSQAILGLVTGLDPRQVKAELWQANRLVATALVDELGNFAISGLAPGRYELSLSGPQIEIHIQDLEIGSQGRAYQGNRR